MVGLVAPLGVLLTAGTWFMFDRGAPERATATTTTTTTMLPRLAEAGAATPGGLDGPAGPDNAYLPADPDRITGSADNQLFGPVDSPPTTSAPQRVDRRISQVAWAWPGKVSVSEVPPPGWATMPRIGTWQQPEMAYSATAHQRIAALPREGYALTGRVKTPRGGSSTARHRTARPSACSSPSGAATGPRC